MSFEVWFSDDTCRILTDVYSIHTSPNPDTIVFYFDPYFDSEKSISFLRSSIVYMSLITTPFL